VRCWHQPRPLAAAHALPQATPFCGRTPHTLRPDCLSAGTGLCGCAQSVAKVTQSFAGLATSEPAPSGGVGGGGASSAAGGAGLPKAAVKQESSAAVKQEGGDDVDDDFL
jgi:hypothetical protein